MPTEKVDVDVRRAGQELLAAHGSGAGSLIGVAQEKGLVPVGWMLSGKVQAVPFSGELDQGIGPRGVNRVGISVSTLATVALKHAYAYFNLEGWTPEWSEAFESGYITDSTRMQIEYKRRAAWEELTSVEKEFVVSPFPLLYGIPRFASRKMLSILKPLDPREERGTEFYAKGKVPALRLVLVVPMTRISKVQEYLESKSVQVCRILPMETIEKDVVPLDKIWRSNMREAGVMQKYDRRQLICF